MLFLVDTQPRSLLEPLGAPRKIALVWCVLGMNINMFLQVLVLSETTPTKVADESFETKMVDNQVSPEAQTSCELFATVIQGARELFLVFLSICYILEPLLNVAFLAVR